MSKKDIAIDSFCSTDKDWSVSILSAYNFARNTSQSQVINCLKSVSIGSSDPLKSHFDTAISNSDKKMAILMLDLLEPERLKDIYSLTRLRRRGPITTFEVSSINDPLNAIDESELLDELDKTAREFSKWHAFEYRGNQYLVLKIHDDDNVRIQPLMNAEVEEGELLILKSEISSNTVRVFAEEGGNDGVLGATQRGIRDGVETANPSISNVDVSPVDESITGKEYDEAIDKIDSGNFGNNLTLHKLHLKNAPLTGSPTIRLSDASGDLLKVVNELANRGIDLFGDPDSITQIGFEYQGRKFTLYPKENNGTVSINYGSSINDDTLLDQFESEVQSVLGIDIVFERK
jgi:hypothetical protein